MKKAVKIFVIIAVCLNTAHVFAQINIKGRIIDSESNQPIEFANVVLQTSDSVYFAGTESNEKGIFHFAKIKPGDYRIVVSMMGYASTTVTLDELAANINLNDIILSPVYVELEEVTITAVLLCQNSTFLNRTKNSLASSIDKHKGGSKRKT